MKIELISSTSKDELENRIKNIAAAGKLSRRSGTVFDVLDSCEDYEKNLRTIKSIIGMGHKSIIEHDYFVFAISDVTPIVEQTLIGQRLASFTIKSRREVDFSNVGYYIPDFSYLENGEEVRKKYVEHMDYLFNQYSRLVESGIKKEDARFILPYSYHSNIIMGLDARSLEKLVKSLLNSELSNIPELRELGLEFKKIIGKFAEYLTIDENDETIKEDRFAFLDEIIACDDYQIIEKPTIISSTSNVDEVIITSLIMNRYQVDKEQARNLLKKLSESDKEKIMFTIYNSPEQRELEQVSFTVQIPISLAVLTHLTRHRMHSLLIPNFIPIWDLNKFKIPPTIKDENLDVYNEVYRKNIALYNEFKSMGVKEEDLIYFYLSGNMCNVTTTVNGRSLMWISKMRCCNKAQWEIRRIFQSIVDDVKNLAPLYGKYLGPTCEVEHVCNEGKESCGKVKVFTDGAKK